MTAGKDGTVESVEQLTSKDLQLQFTKNKEVNAAWAWLSAVRFFLSFLIQVGTAI